MTDTPSKLHQNQDFVRNNKTIFDFLKHKKQISLQKTLNSRSQTKRKYQDTQDEFPITRDLSRHRNYNQSNKLATQTARNTVTPKKLQFDEHQNKSDQKQFHAHPAANHKKAKSFLSMISPIKQRPFQVNQEFQQKENETTSKSKRKIFGKAQTFARGKVTKSINSIKETISALHSNLAKIKQKVHGLSILFNPILCEVDPNGDLRIRLREIENMVQSISLQSGDQLIEVFHKNLTEYIQNQVQQDRIGIEKQKQQYISNFRSEKQSKIQQLTLQLKKAHKQNDLLSRRVDQMEQNKNKHQQAASERQMNLVQKIDSQKQKYQTQFKQLSLKNTLLVQSLQLAQKQLKQVQKAYKDEKNLKQTFQNKHRQEIQQISSAKDAYLLNQIMILKTQFNADIARINKLHKIKQVQLAQRLAQKEQQIQKRNFEKSCDRQVQPKILEQANLVKKQNIQLKNKSQCLITDMYRMNQELYQHWMALKDVKMLATRLGSYAQFRKIYDDLLFNDHLFN